MPKKPNMFAARAGLAALAAALLLCGCGGTRVRSAPPVEDRGSALTGATAAAAAASAAAAKPLPGAENAGKPGYYTVKPGDTLIRIGLESGQSWKDIARWNKLENPDLIEPGQVLRIATPAVSGSAHGAQGPGADSGVVTRPVTSATITPSAPAAGASRAADRVPKSAADPSSSVVALAPATPLPTPAPAGEEDIAFVWPAPGTLIAGFDEVRNKGLDIAGKAGDPVLAAADGRVVYAGAGLRGYGNLLIVKHNNTFLTAYAHNQRLLVKEDQEVRRGQKIAEMGNSDADRVKLHFELRRQGKPVDPTRYLPAR